MSVSRKQFIDNLDASGIMTEAEISAWLSNHPRELDPIDGDAMAAILIDDGVLTSYQAQSLNRERPRPLKYGNYDLLEIIGQGGMGTVYKARHKMMKHDVAIKVISSKQGDESDNRFKRFQREVQTAGKLSHNNIVSALDAGEENDKFFLVMELVLGEDLGKISKCEGELPVDEVLDYMTQAAVGLQYAHDEGIVHRDIKPHNLLLSSDGIVKILDLGLVSLQRSEDSIDDSLTGQNQIIGTVDYMSPEQAKDVHSVDPRADIYSLGCTLFRLLTGKAPYPGNSTIERLLAHRDNTIPSLHQFRTDIPELLDRIFQRMVAKEPDDRYQTMEEVTEAFETCRLASVSIMPVIQTEETTVSNIEEFSLDLEIHDASTLEVAYTELESIETDTPVLPTPVAAGPSIDSGSVIEQTQVTQRAGKGNQILIALTVLILLGAGGGYWYANRPGYVEVDFPIEYREGRWAVEILDGRDKKVVHLTEVDADGYENTNPIKIPLAPGNYTYALMRPPFFPNTGRFEMQRSKTIIVNGSSWDTSDLQELGLINSPVEQEPPSPENESEQ